MASRAKQSVSKKQKSFAAAVKGVKTPSVFAKTSCKMTMPPGFPHRRLPKPTMENSFFIDLRTTDASDLEVAEALDKKCKNIQGIHYRDDLRVVEVIFATEEERNSHLGGIAIPNRKTVYPTFRLDDHRTVYIKMANIPYGDEKKLGKAIEEYWEQFGLVIATAPHKVHGKWATRRWDLMITIPKDEKFEAPVAFELLGASIVAEWPKSLPSCLICKKAGHQARQCPSKNPKAGERPNPDKKDQQVTPAKIGHQKTEAEKTPKTGLEDVPLPGHKKTDQIGAQSASASVTSSVSATVSETASVSVTASVKKSPDSETKKPEPQTVKKATDSGVNKGKMRIDEDESEGETCQPEPEVYLGHGTETVDLQRETTTPPPLPLEDPDTPRKGNKRMVKEDKAAESFKKFAVAEGEVGARRSGRKRTAKRK